MTNHNKLIDVHVHEMGNDMQNISFIITYGFQFLCLLITSINKLQTSFLSSIQICIVNITIRYCQCIRQFKVSINQLFKSQFLLLDELFIPKPSVICRVELNVRLIRRVVGGIRLPRSAHRKQIQASGLTSRISK